MKFSLNIVKIGHVAKKKEFGKRYETVVNPLKTGMKQQINLM